MIVSREAERLNAALTNSEVAYSYFDSADRLLFWNDAYLRLNFRIQAHIRRGARFSELLAALVAADQISIVGDVNDWIAARLAARQTGATALRTLTNGKTYIVQERKDEIGGTLGVWVDITHLVSTGSIVGEENLLNGTAPTMSNVDVQDMLRNKLQTVLTTLEFIEVMSGDSEMSAPISEAISAIEYISVILDVERDAA